MTDRTQNVEPPRTLRRQLKVRGRRRRTQMAAAAQIGSFGPGRNDLLPNLAIEFLPWRTLLACQNLQIRTTYAAD